MRAQLLSKYKRIEVPGENELNHFTRRLVPEQMNVLRKVIESCKDVVKSRNVPTLKPRQTMLLVHGGAGKIHFLIFTGSLKVNSYDVYMF